MGKMKLHNFRKPEALTLSQFGGSIYVYIDPVNGNDNSDGLSETTAWKTIAKFNSFIIKTTFSSINLHLMADSIDEVITIPHSAQVGTMGIFGLPKTSGVTRTRVKGINSTDVNYLAINDVDVISDNATQVVVNNGNAKWTRGRVEYTGADSSIAHGVVTSNTNMLFDGVTFANLKYAAVCRNGIMNLRAATFETQTEVSSINSVVSLGNDNYKSGKVLVLTDHYDSPGLITDMVAESVVVESGRNANGSYVKYADGRLVISILHELVENLQPNNGTDARIYSTVIQSPIAFFTSTAVITSDMSASMGYGGAWIRHNSLVMPQLDSSLVINVLPDEPISIVTSLRIMIETRWK